LSRRAAYRHDDDDVPRGADAAERALTTALRATSTYRITDQSLELFDGERLVARFESRCL
jgi:hypothetical protein